MEAEARHIDIRRLPLVVPDWVVEVGFVGLLLCVFVGRNPFNPPLNETLVQTSLGGSGDALRQVAYLGVFFLILAGSIQKRGLAILGAVPPMMALLIAWCCASTFWAIEPDIALRRAILQGILVVSASFAIDAIGAERSLMFIRNVLGGILLVNLVSIPIVPTARHLPGELDPQLVGDWRGLFAHKNIAGSISSITAIMFLFSGLEKKRWLDFMMAALAALFVVMSHSKSSLGLLPVALALGALYGFGWRRPLDRTIVLLGLTVFLVLAAVGVAINWDALVNLLSDPASFTGRTEIWQAELAYIHDHPLLGSGFGTFSDTGAVSPLAQYVSGDWVKEVSHGHSGYLQMLFMLGWIGMVITMLAFIVMPVIHFWRIDRPTWFIRTTLFTIFIFLIMHNFLELDFFQDDGAPGFAILLTIALLAILEREHRRRPIADAHSY